MCGICGVIGSDPQVITTAVPPMMQAMLHRGPDDGGMEILPLGLAASGPFAGFGFRRLSILDLSPAGHQPMFNPETGDCLIFNGEIYNFRDLRAQLSSMGVTFRSSGDTEVLLQALSSWREAALEKIQGMFALAFYHAATRRVLLARDPLGMKQLYVADTGRELVFASEIRAVRASGLVSGELDVPGIASMLAYGAVQSPRTVFRQIRSFPPGSYQWIGGDALTGRSPPKRFWNFSAQTRPPQEHAATVTEVRGLLRDAVLRHLVADVPVGVFLSAGIDSTIVASLARDFTPQVTAFTVGFDAAHGTDEVAIAASTAKALGIPHVALRVDSHTLETRWSQWLASLDAPSVDGFNTYVVSQCLADADVVVALSGLGADELFGGYGSFSQAPRLAPLVRALGFIPPWLRAGTVAAAGCLDRRSGAFGKFADLVAGDPSIAGITRSMRRTLPSKMLRGMRLSAGSHGLRPDYLDATNPFLANVHDGDAFNEVSRTELTHYMADTLLRDTDTNSMAHSLEVRVPFLHLPLIDYVSALPGAAKRQAGGPPKRLLRDVGEEMLGDAVRNRPKTGFTLPIERWMRNEMRDSSTAAVEHLAGLPFLEGSGMRRLWEAFLRDERSMHWSRPLSLVALGTYLMNADRPAAG